ncbi:hypothetical protein H6G54_12065 [Anabaena cylindrica FACHB-243]|uniref:Uncharacterized protein n=1 Tax=Anabaena cylindrica (strain ATCC 27899 / PCC 7122) TaxID=272123 RepID=K9ZCL2_ANACC|nr:MULTISPECIES: hypothetical protein [Anabaena]AFZ56916.1 hypothetical protein Anacy_1405 [Anabaena cylindrica PCC 7122]MBD2418418.1 hypothetical protein [Anabaena cylindrica FACHB-243]MBY5284365.1 hypothetical protein [Anabaena sp. CCAP 1446/1C]MBY5307640.1 hypothetical protein [Anabaena sp. CCAP 1446/1C]MCM2409399.1 hypothetical protein [Anabaena sp. CCAP 1446/1C]
MAQYCNTGDTARITFPDSSTEEFTDTPVNITAEPDTSTCASFTASFNASYIQSGVNFSNRTLGFIGRYPYNGWRFTGSSIEVNNALYLCPPGTSTQWDDISGGINRYVYEGSLISITPANYKIFVTGASGELLYEGIFPTDNYSVECIEGCPPGTLDCGDCCLPCDEIFNSISDIRALVSRLR